MTTLKVDRARAQVVRAASLCVVCVTEPAEGVLLCKLCGCSWDRDAQKDETIAAAIIWAANRARRAQAAARRREKKRER
jgi:hypothetical protein